MILFLGDLHGNFKYMMDLIKRTRISNCAIFQVGDFGVGFSKLAYEKENLLKINKFMKERSIILYVIRGNHDCPDFFKGDYIYDNLKLMPDYSVVEYDDHKLLLIGGAISIDRKIRLLNDNLAASYGSNKKSYWIDEKLVLIEELLNTISGIDVLVTHTAPDWCTPLNKIGFGGLVDSFSENDPTLKDELKEERQLMSRIFNIVQKQSFIKNHFYGHFHKSNVTLTNGCLHQLVNINEFVELK